MRENEGRHRGRDEVFEASAIPLILIPRKTGGGERG